MTRPLFSRGDIVVILAGGHTGEMGIVEHVVRHEDAEGYCVRIAGQDTTLVLLDHEIAHDVVLEELAET